MKVSNKEYSDQSVQYFDLEECRENKMCMLSDIYVWYFQVITFILGTYVCLRYLYESLKTILPESAKS